ncbi:MAG: alkene reductase [Phycisphaerales bacterium]
MPDLFTPLPLGPFTLPNRVLMAPLTRCRAEPDGTPGELAPLYYAQRASAGLIISEATCIEPRAHGYPTVPGIYTPAHVDGWRRVTRAVHDAGGRIACQLWHVGRYSHPDYQTGHAPPIAPSAVNPGGTCRTPTGPKPRTTPRALETSEIPGIIADYHHAAKCALDAGFDLVELHGANGYLPEQFLRDGTNHRSDRYGGSLPNRARFLLEAAEAIISVWGSDRVGVRLSPAGHHGQAGDSNPRQTYEHAVRELSNLGVAFQHIMQPWGPQDEQTLTSDLFRPLVSSVLITNAGFTFETATHQLREGRADAVAFGKLFISNPDLPERFRMGGELTPWDESTFYTPGAKGYTDYASSEP